MYINGYKRKDILKEINENGDFLIRPLMYEQKLQYCKASTCMHIASHFSPQGNREKEVDEITRDDKSSLKLKSDTWNKEKCALSAVFFNFFLYFPVECLSNAWLNAWLNFWENERQGNLHFEELLFIPLYKMLRYNFIVERERENNDILISPLPRIKFHKNISYKNCAILRHDRENRIYPSRKVNEIRRSTSFSSLERSYIFFIDIR